MRIEFVIVIHNSNRVYCGYKDNKPLFMPFGNCEYKTFDTWDETGLAIREIIGDCESGTRLKIEKHYVA